MNEFYLADEKHPKLDGKVVERKGVLYFRCPKAGFDGKADKDHVKNFAGEFGEFKNKHPGFKLAWDEEKEPLDVKALQPGEMSSVPVVEKLSAKEAAKLKKEHDAELKKEHTDRDRPVK